MNNNLLFAVHHNKKIEKNLKNHYKIDKGEEYCMLYGKNDFKRQERIKKE